MKRMFRLPHGGGDPSRDVEREIALHIDLRTKELEATGLTHDEARRVALAAFGDRSEVEDEVKRIHASNVRRRKWGDWLDDVWKDVVVGARILRRAPTFTLIAVLTLGIGIGANTAIFSVLRSVLLRSLPYPDAEQLVQLWTDHRALGRQAPEWLTPPDFADWRDDNHTFSAMAAYNFWAPIITAGGDPETLNGLVVSGNFFDMLGIAPLHGRLLTMADDDAGAEPVVMLTEPLWRRRFGGDLSVVGRPVTLNGTPWTVVGVLPASFRVPVNFAGTEILGPIRRPSNSGCGRGCVTVRAIGRLKPGVSFASAQADIATIAARQAAEFPETNARVGSWLIPLDEQLTGPTRAPLIALSVAVGFVLLIGCVNLATLLLVRGAGRARELAVRAALGAGRHRVLRQLLTENVLLAAVGGVLGIAIGLAGSRVFGVLVPEAVRQVQPISVDAAVLGFAALVTILSAALFGLLPALRVSGARLMTSLRTGRADIGGGAVLRGGLVVVQISMAVVLLVGAGLLLRSFLKMQRVDLGYRDSGIYFAGVAFPRARYADGPRAGGAIEDLLERLRGDPAVRSAELTDLPPLMPGDQDMTAIPLGEPERPDKPPSIWYRSVSAGYLSQMGMSLVAGRPFSQEDRAGGPLVGIINEEAARRFWPGGNALGRVLASGTSPDSRKMTIVGIVASGRHDGPSQPYKPEMFLAFSQVPTRAVTLILEPAGDEAALASALRRALAEVDPLIPVPTLDPIEAQLGQSVALPRVYATLVGAFAGAALLLAALGVYGVIAYAVSQRQREIGMRLALGAAPGRIQRMMLADGGRLAVMGLAVGLGGALLTGRLLTKLLFGVGPLDVPTLVAVPVVLAAVTLIASWIPARRAMRLDPITAIRDE